MKSTLLKPTFLIVLCILLGINKGLSQQNFYISSTGSDSNNGTSPSSAWKTINKVNSQKGAFAAGDFINFNRGDVFYGSLDLKGKSGSLSESITLKSYGSGRQAVIRAARRVNNWTRLRGNIWKANLPKINNERTPSLFLNNISQQIGREPNFNIADGGYRSIGMHTNNNKSISDGVNLPYEANRFRGGEITIRTTDDNIKREIITSHSGKTINFNLSHPGSNFENSIEDGFGYFFQNHVNTLDTNGEWAHDTNTDVLYLYSNSNPNTLNVEVPSGETAISLNNSNNITIRDLRFEGGLSQTLALSGASNINISGCYISNGNNYLTLGFTLTNITFINNTLDQSNNLAVRWEGISGVTFANNKITNIGMRSGMGVRSFIGYSGIRFYGRSGAAPNIIEKNTLKNIGYHGLQFGGSNFKIRYNDISNYCFTKDDGGGIYTVENRETNNSIYKNIVHDSPGAIRGIPQNRGVKTAGIYIDNDSQNQRIYENTVYNIVGWGLMANLSSKSTLRDNTIYNCDFGIVLSTYPNTFAAGGRPAKATNNTIVRNVFFAKKPWQFCARYTNQITESGFNNFLGEVNNNFYCQPFTGGKELSLRTGRIEREMVLSEFKSAYPNYEKNGKVTPKKFPISANPNNVSRLEVNNLGSPKQINLGNTNYLDAKNIAYSGSITLPAYSSVALLRGDGVTPPASQLITNGTYHVSSITSNQRLRSIGSNDYKATMISPASGAAQKWIFNHLGNNFYTIKNLVNGRYLEVPFAKCENGTQVSTYTQASASHQKWKVVENGTGTYGLKPAHCLTQGLDRNNGTLNTNVITFSFGLDNGNQKWKIVPVSSRQLNVQQIKEEVFDLSYDIRIYPNPANEFVEISNLVKGDKIQLSDINGKILQVIETKGSNSILDTSYFESGLYFINVIGKKNLKLIIE